MRRMREKHTRIRLGHERQCPKWPQREHLLLWLRERSATAKGMINGGARFVTAGGLPWDALDFFAAWRFCWALC
jgi:hypothetical protein